MSDVNIWGTTGTGGAVVTLPVSVSQGGTGATTEADARTALSIYSKSEIDAAFALAVRKTSDTGAARIPVGTTSERDASPVAGDFRRNTTTGYWEGYNGSTWDSFAQQSEPVRNSFRNKLINGGFEVAQRGTSQTQATQGYGSVDRWAIGSTSGSWTATVGASAGLNPVGRYLNIAATLVVGGYLIQRIESVETLQGKTCTLSYYYNNNSGANTGAQPYLTQYFGSSGSGPVTINATSDVVIGNRRILTYNVNSTSGLTIAGGNDYLQVVIPFSGTFNGSFYGIQLEEGDAVTPFEVIPKAVTLDICQRYCKPVPRTVGQAVSATSVSAFYDTSKMRDPTTLTLSKTTGWTSATAGATFNSIAVVLQVSVNGDAYVLGSSGSGMAPGQASMVVPPAGTFFLSEL